MNKELIFEPKPELAVIEIIRKGFMLEKWAKIEAQYGFPITEEDQLKRAYGIILNHNNQQYVIGRLFCNAVAHVQYHGKNEHQKGYFFDFDIDSLASDLGIWDKDQDKKDEFRFPVLQTSNTAEPPTYHVNPGFDREATLEKIVYLSKWFESIGFTPSHSHLDDPRYIKFLNEGDSS